MNDTGTVSSDDVITAYRDKLSEVLHENALLRAQVAKLLRERQGSPQAAIQAGRYPRTVSQDTA